MKSYFDSVAPLIEEAGIELARHFGKTEAIAFKSESYGSAVTELDRKTEQFLAERLHNLYPDIGFVGEEFGGDSSVDRFWLVDPIDGTAHFIRGIPFATTMIALIQEGEVVFSIINNFITKEMYSAEKGKGAFLNGASVRVSSRPFKDAYISFETNRRKQENLEKFLAVSSRCHVMATFNSGFEHCLVASGKIEARMCLEPHGEDWDYAPGSLLVSEAGGIVRNIGSDSYDYRNHNFIAANPAAHEKLSELLK